MRVMATMQTGVSPIESLDGEDYISLTTFRKDGSPVPTPVWFAVENGTIYVTTLAESYKIKRIRHTPQVTVVPCDVRGNVDKDKTPFAGHATIHPKASAVGEKAGHLLNKKYGLLKRAIDIVNWFRRGEYIFIAITPTN